MYATPYEPILNHPQVRHRGKFELKPTLGGYPASTTMSSETALQVTQEELNPCTLLLTVECSTDQVRAGFEKAYKAAAKRIKIPGFRPGAAPRNVVKQYADPQWVNEVAREEIIKVAYHEAINGKNLKPHGSPRVEVTQFDEEAFQCVFKAKVPLAPKVTVGEYTGLEAERPKLEVADAEVERYIETLREDKAKRAAVEGRGAQVGDFAVVNIKVEGEEGDGKTFWTEVGETFPQLDQALTGMKLDDFKNVDLTFPDNFQDKDWAGKPMSCQVRLRSLSALEMPELTDEFAQQFNSEGIEDLKTKVKERMLAVKEQMSQNYVDEQLVDALLKKSEVISPDPMWEQVAEQRLQEIAAEAAQSQKTLEDVAQANNMTFKELVEQLREEARSEVNRALLITEIFQKENMKLEREDVSAEIIEVARENGISPDEAMAALKRAGNMEEIQFRAMRKKVLALLNSTAKVTETKA